MLRSTLFAIWLMLAGGAAAAPVRPAAPASDPPSKPETVVITDKPTPSEKSKKKRTFVPPGFEELLEPQTTVVDVYYGGSYLVSSPATFTPTEIEFLEPEAMVDKIPDLLEPERIAEILGSEMPTNSELICLNQRNPDCGEIETDTAAVIFDDGRFRADLFIAPEMLSVRPATASKFLPRSSAGLSLLNSTSAMVNGAEGEPGNFNVGNSTTVAWRENRLYAVSNLTREEDFSVDTLALQREVNGQQLQGGIFRSNPGTLIFLRQADFQGISLASSLNTRQDLDQSAGNDLQVFLDSRSRVDILKDGRLISSAVYDTGNQILDTSQLPGGAYDVTLRIRDNFGGVREETRFYVKTNRLPPKDQPLYFIDVGETAEDTADRVLPEGTGDRFFRAGYARRLSKKFGGEVGVLASEANNLFEAGIFKLGRSYELRFNGAVSNENSRGLSLNARTRLGTTSINTNVRRVWSESATSPIGSELTQASLNVSMPIGRSSLNITARYNDRENSTDRNIGLRYDFPTYRFGDRVLDTSMQVTRDNGSVLVLLGARLSIRSGRWRNRLSTQIFRDRPENMESNQGVITDVASIWQDGDRFLSDVTWIMRANDGQEDRTLETELDIEGGLGRANMEAVYSDEAQRFSYAGNFYTSMIADAQTIAIGARQQGQSAVVLDIEGSERDAYFDVEINDMRRGTAPIGEKTVIGLTPFDTYEISLQPRGNAIVDFEQRPRRATLYPGNVVTMDWSVARVVVAFGQIVRPDGDPVSDAIIEGVIGLATTDEFGMFQAEFSSDAETLAVRTREDECRVELPDYDGSKLMVTLGKLTCR